MTMHDVLKIDEIAALFARKAKGERVGFVVHLLGELARSDAEAVDDAMRRRQANEERAKQ